MLKFLYILFFICGIFGGSTYIRDIISFRQLASILMMVYCVYNIRFLLNSFNKYIGLYLVFIVFWVISSLFENSLDKCLRSLIAQHFVSLIGYFATVLLYRRCGSLNILFKVIFITGLINSVVCLLQYIGNSIGIMFGMFFVDVDNESIVNHLEMLSSGMNQGSYLFGLLGNAVNNGYFSMILPLIPFYFFSQGKMKLVIASIFSIFFLIILFLIQQRSCFIFSSAMLIILLLKNKIISTNGLFIILTFLSVPTIYLLMELINSDVVQNSRLISHTEESRTQIYSLAIAFIQDNLLFGGLEKFRSLARFSPHNIVLNSFIYGGLMGGLILMVLYISQLLLSISLLRYRQKSTVAAIFITLSLNALLHNNSILTGDLQIWILWGAVFCVSKLNKSINEYSRKPFSRKNGVSSYIGNNTGLQCREISAAVR